MGGEEDVMKHLSIEERLGLNNYQVDDQPHIIVKQELCATCDWRACVYVCPAECYRLEDGKVIFSYEGCLECGSCRVACDKKAVDWNYPRGGFGVNFEFG